MLGMINKLFFHQQTGFDFMFDCCAIKVNRTRWRRLDQ